MTVILVDGLRQGGLMRCCIETVRDLYPDGPALAATEGQTLQCKYTSDPLHRMIFTDGAWQWDHKEETYDCRSPGNY